MPCKLSLFSDEMIHLAACNMSTSEKRALGIYNNCVWNVLISNSSVCLLAYVGHLITISQCKCRLPHFIKCIFAGKLKPNIAQFHISPAAQHRLMITNESTRMHQLKFSVDHGRCAAICIQCASL